MLSVKSIGSKPGSSNPAKSHSIDVRFSLSLGLKHILHSNLNDKINCDDGNFSVQTHFTDPPSKVKTAFGMRDFLLPKLAFCSVKQS